MASVTWRGQGQHISTGLTPMLSSTARPLRAPIERIVKQVSQEEHPAADEEKRRPRKFYYEEIDQRTSVSMMEVDHRFEEQVQQLQKIISELPWNKLIYFVFLVALSGFFGAASEFSPEWLVVGVSACSFVMFFALHI